MLRRARLASALACACAILAPPSSAQHPLPPRARPLHARLAEADAAAIVRVEAVELGRLHVERIDALAGSVPERFAVKRSPSSPPPLQAGDRALVFLAGARPPYVLVDSAKEVLVVDEEEDREALARAVREVAAAGAGEDLAELYVGWLEGDEKRLRELAILAVLDPRGVLVPLPERLVPGRVEAALDPTRGELVRGLTATLAASRPTGVSALLERLLARDDPEPAILQTALRAAVVQRLPVLAGAVRRGLAHQSPAAREATLEVLLYLPAGDIGLRPTVERLAREDAHADVRAQAERVLAYWNRQSNS